LFVAAVALEADGRRGDAAAALVGDAVSGHVVTVVDEVVGLEIDVEDWVLVGDIDLLGGDVRQVDVRGRAAGEGQRGGNEGECCFHAVSLISVGDGVKLFGATLPRKPTSDAHG
jgi:hypothetical protein